MIASLPAANSAWSVRFLCRTPGVARGGYAYRSPPDLLRRLAAWMRETDDPLLQGAVTSPLHRRAVTKLLNG